VVLNSKQKDKRILGTF